MNDQTHPLVEKITQTRIRNISPQEVRIQGALTLGLLNNVDWDVYLELSVLSVLGRDIDISITNRVRREEWASFIQRAST